MAWYDDVWDYAKENALELAKIGVGGAKAYIDYKDQKRRNELEEQAYRDYIANVEAAGKEAQAAIDLNLMPMEIQNVPTTKADVSDFTAVAAKGGLMNLPTRQRKRYATGPQEIDVMEMDEEVITPDYLMKEEGVQIGPMASGNYTQEEIEAYENYKYDMEEQRPGMPIMEIDDFLRFYYNAKNKNKNKMMAKGPEEGDTTLADEMPTWSEAAYEDEFMKPAANGGIIGLRHGGRPGYNMGVGPLDIVYNPGVQMTRNKQQRGQQTSEKPDWFQDLYLNREGGGGKDFMVPEKYINLMPGGDERIDQMNIDAAEQETFERGAGNRLMNHAIAILRKASDIDPELGNQINEEFIAMANDENFDPGDAYYTIIEKYGEILEMKKGGIAGLKKGGRVKRNVGGIMDLGGMEKDYRFTGGFVPIGAYEKKDDVPARLSKNEFVMTADAVRAAGGGSINKGAKRMYDTMKHLEARPEAKRMTA
jgi:hypothetical protein